MVSASLRSSLVVVLGLLFSLGSGVALAHHDDDDSHDSPVALAAHHLSDVSQVFADVVYVKEGNALFRNDATTLHDAVETFHEEVESAPGIDFTQTFVKVQQSFEQLRNDFLAAHEVHHDPQVFNAWFAVENAYLDLREAVTHPSPVNGFPPGPADEE